MDQPLTPASPGATSSQTQVHARISAKYHVQDNRSHHPKRSISLAFKAFLLYPPGVHFQGCCYQYRTSNSTLIPCNYPLLFLVWHQFNQKNSLIQTCELFSSEQDPIPRVESLVDNEIWRLQLISKGHEARKGGGS